MGCSWVYDPPAFASLRVPLLLTQKGEGPRLSPLDSGFRRNDVEGEGGSQTRPYRQPRRGALCRPAPPGIPRALASLVRAPFVLRKGRWAYTGGHDCYGTGGGLQCS